MSRDSRGWGRVTIGHPGALEDRLHERCLVDHQSVRRGAYDRQTQDVLGLNLPQVVHASRTHLPHAVEHACLENHVHGAAGANEIVDPNQQENCVDSFRTSVNVKTHVVGEGLEPERGENGVDFLVPESAALRTAGDSLAAQMDCGAVGNTILEFTLLFLSYVSYFRELYVKTCQSYQVLMIRGDIWDNSLCC